VGCGLQFGNHLTPQARASIEGADKVFHLADAVAAIGLAQLNPSAEPLDSFYVLERPRQAIYRAMAEHVLGFVRAGKRVCLVSYGHPGIFADPCHWAIRQARSEGYRAEMLPAISSVDCLFADLLFDPATDGIQIFDATDFLRQRRRFDAASVLVLLQVGLTGELRHRTSVDHRGVDVLAEVLAQTYGLEHEVVLYEASVYAIAEHAIQRVALSDLSSARITKASTLVVPPVRRTPDDREMLERLGLGDAKMPEARHGK
jgi:uncharacterized protein YabN with tetrapyrrole methylase and pyrophosphatase domain